MKILAIDTSADETSVAITEGFRVLSSTISSQITKHADWGGIVPTIARLAHEKRIDAVVKKTIKKAIILKVIEKVNDIDAYAVTIGPGLSIALEVGIKKAKELAVQYNKPLYAVNHMEGHLYSSYVSNINGNPSRDVIFPFFALLISGGHTQIIYAKENGNYETIGETVDDAAGEALDKAAKMLGLGYPGGPIIEKLAQDENNVDFYRFPRPMIKENNCLMSFSGLKTHLYYLLKGTKDIKVDVSTDIKKIASSFQEAVFDAIMKKLAKAVEGKTYTSVVIGGGVSANKRIRNLLRAFVKARQNRIYFPALKYLCGDNASMIGAAAYMMIKRNEKPSDPSLMERIPRLSLGTASVA